MSNFGDCHYCTKKGPVRVTPEDGVQENMYICNHCWKLLQNPVTALPLIRGHLTLTTRGDIPKKKLDKQLNEFMGMISGWKPKN